ncbi:glutamate racemase [Thalassotalea fusca]
MSQLTLSSTANTSLAQRPIGVFDSGLGGLSIQRCISQMLPNEHIIYVADNAYAPYGCKTEEEINARVLQIGQWFHVQKVKAIVVACNTATASSIEKLREQYHIPIIGVEPAIKPAVEQSKTNKVGLLVTSATANNSRFKQLVARYADSAEVLIQPCPGLVDLIEQGQHQSDECHKLLLQYLTPLIYAGVDTIVLGCTHYPFLAPMIERIVGANIALMETARPVTEQLIRQLAKYALLNQSSNNPELSFWASNPSEQLSRLVSQLLALDIPDIRHIQI